MLGRRIAFLRHCRGISQAALAAKLNISASTLGMYEQGRRSPPSDILISLAGFFHVSTDYLLTGHFYSQKDWEYLGKSLQSCVFNPFCSNFLSVDDQVLVLVVHLQGGP